MTPIYLVDGSGYIFRAFYAIRPLTNSKGLPTNAIYGFTQMMLKFLRDAQPTHAAVVFDTKEPSFRSTLYAEYKANRKEPPDELIPQFPYFRTMVDALGLPRFEQPGFEADDIIASIATRMATAGHEVVIITGDKDFMQLVDDRITLWDTMKERRSTVAEVRARFGVDPAQVVDVQALAGDSVDNVKGVPGIGEKTAAKLISAYGSLENLLAMAENIPGKTGERLRAHADDARLAKRLCALHADVQIADGEDALVVQPFRMEQLQPLLMELEFTRLLQSLLVPTPSAAPTTLALPTAPAGNYQLVTTAAQLTAVVAAIRTARRFAIDTETVGLNPRHATLVGISLAVEAGAGYYIPLHHRTLDATTQLPLETVAEALRPLCADPTIEIVCQHAKFDLPILRRHGLPIDHLACDTMVAAYLLDPGGSHGLDALAQRYCHYRMVSYADVVGSGKAQITFAEVPLDRACRYAAEDADLTLRLANLFAPRIEAEGLGPLLHDIEMPLIAILIAMEDAGFCLDAAFLRTLHHEFTERLAVIEKNIYAAAGTEFNIASPQQLGVILFDTLQLPGKKKTKTGYSTSAETLEAIAQHHPLPQLILDYRGMAKLLSTYIDALPKLIDPTTGRLHTTLQQTATATGRLSSRDPNLQNIPIRSDEGRRIREAFVAAPGCVLLAADYSQIELRILAHLSGDDRLCAAFRDDRDVHTETAATLCNVPLEQVTPSQRSVGKTVNFAVIYGQTAYGMARQLHIPWPQAQTYIEQYFALYPGVAQYRGDILTSARTHGAVRTLYGRRRPVPELTNSQPNIRAEAERMAFNAVVQGTAADVTKLAMIAVTHALATHRLQSKMILQIHDELILEVPTAEIEHVKTLVRTAMENVTPPTGTFRIPLRVDVKHGMNWAEC